MLALFICDFIKWRSQEECSNSHFYTILLNTVFHHEIFFSMMPWIDKSLVAVIWYRNSGLHWNHCCYSFLVDFRNIVVWRKYCTYLINQQNDIYYCSTNYWKLMQWKYMYWYTGCHLMNLLLLSFTSEFLFWNTCTCMCIYAPSHECCFGNTEKVRNTGV